VLIRITPNEPLIDSTVIGMGQFDIDGLEKEDQQELLKISSNILGVGTLIVLLMGTAFATVVLDKIFLYGDVKNSINIDSF